jgi:NAD(P)-dependent dehydrogenase (short-subunit alcohol dehydrogenase family)
MLLENKNAVIYGGGGAMGEVVAHAFAREGARVFLAGRTLSTLDEVANAITSAGGKAESAQVDAVDSQAVEAHLDEVVKKAGSIDISFNLMGMGAPQGTALVDMAIDDFVSPIAHTMQGHLTTATAAGRRMMKQQAGVILALTAQAGRKPYTSAGGFGVACAAIEGLCRQLAAELGPYNIRVVCLRSSGSPDTPGVREAMKLHAKNAGTTLEAWQGKMAENTLLKRLPLLAEVANVAVLMASDYAGIMTASVANVTCGELVD